MFGTTNQFCMDIVDYIIIQFTYYVYICVCGHPPLIYLEAFYMKITMIYVYTYMIIYIYMYIYILYTIHTLDSKYINQDIKIQNNTLWCYQAWFAGKSPISFNGYQIYINTQVGLGISQPTMFDDTGVISECFVT